MKDYSYNCGRPVEKFVVPTLAETMNLINKLKSNHRVFRADFLKRTTGEMRTMLCMFGVKKHLKGGKAAYHFGDKGLLSVFDINKQAYRSIPIDNIRLIKSAGIVYLLNNSLPAGAYDPTGFYEEYPNHRTVPASTSPLQVALTTGDSAPLSLTG